MPLASAVASLALAARLAHPAAFTEADLAPALDGPAREAGALFEERRFAEAAARLARAGGPDARFLRALALAEAKRPEEALAVSKGLDAALPAIADRVAFLRGQELDELHRPEEAARAYALVPAGSVLFGAARVAEARALEAQGDRPRALDALAPVLALPAPSDLGKPDPGAVALLLAGRLRADGGEAASARAAFVECWAGHPLAPEAADCRAGLAALPGAAGAPPAPTDVARRADALLAQNRNAAAARELEGLLPGLPEAGPGEAFACEVRSALGRAYRKERRFPEAIATLAPVAERCDDEAIRARALFVVAGATAIAGDKDQAVAMYLRLAREHPTYAYADDALFQAAELLVREGRPADASRALGLVASARGPDRDEARFRLAWLAKQAGETDSAIAQLLAIEEDARDRDPYEHARAAYWRARLLASKGEAGREAAKAIWGDLARRYPADYYGLVARSRLSELAGEDGDGLPPPVTAPAPLEVRYDPGPLAQDPHFLAGVLLLRLGLARQAADELDAVDRKVLRAQDPDPVLLLADLLDRARDHQSASLLLRTLARGALRRAPEGQNLRVWRVAYPPAYRDEVRRYAPAAGVPVDLLQALMREESGLDPRAVSPAGAVGLTQLMLPTARSVARRAGLPRPTRASLMRPPTAIRLGARFLGQLIRRFDGSVALALAAYNAGGGAVGRWLSERGKLDLDEWVEEIPYDETRGYVKRVLRSYAAYRLLYGKPAEEALDLRLALPGS